MHKSKLCGFIIDCDTNDLPAATTFWSGALGMQSKHDPAVDGDNYARLIDPLHRLHIEVQSVNHPSRVHLDIETDDIEAEVARLEALGAKRVEKIKSWWVLQAPTGQRFCVVRKSAADFDATANVWQ